VGHNAADYTFWGLMNNGVEVDTPVDTLVYLVGLVDTADNEVSKLEKANFMLSFLYDVEEQVESVSHLLERQQEIFPKGYYPQTPVMMTLKWSPIAALLERGLEPVVLSRETDWMDCASGIWEIKAVESAKPREACETAEELFWHVLKKVADKAKGKGLLLSIVAQPGWDYHDEVSVLRNLTQAEAEEADRVIWQRTPRRVTA